MTFWGRELSADDRRLVAMAVEAAQKSGRMLRTNQIAADKQDVRRLNQMAVNGILEQAGLRVLIPIGGWPGVTIKEAEECKSSQSTRRRSAGGRTQAARRARGT